MHLRLGTRASALARWQADWVAAQLTATGAKVELVPITTQGDAVQKESIAALSSSPGVFTKELQRALLDNQIDLAVHSLKDLPTDRIDGLVLTAVPERASPWDVLVSRNGQTLDQLPAGARIGTGSQAGVLSCSFGDLICRCTTSAAMSTPGCASSREGQYDALVLAQAGLERLALADQVTQVLPAEIMLPAIGQGALGIECRTDDQATREACVVLNDPNSHSAVIAERAMLAALLGGCLAPVGGWTSVTSHGLLRLTGVVLSGDGRQRIVAEATGPIVEASELGRQVAKQLLAQGAAALIAAARGRPRAPTRITAGNSCTRRIRRSASTGGKNG